MHCVLVRAKLCRTSEKLCTSFLAIDNEKMSKTKKHNMMASYNMQGSTLMFVLFVLLIIFECESRAHWFRTHLNRFYDD